MNSPFVAWFKDDNILYYTDNLCVQIWKKSKINAFRRDVPLQATFLVDFKIFFSIMIFAVKYENSQFLGIYPIK